MSDVISVANYILKAKGKMTALKLQKLVYYSQAWHLAWEDEPLFPEEIQAWANGPVVPVLYNLHRGKFMVEGEFENLKNGTVEPNEESSINVVLGSYGSKSSFELSELTHRESPWIDARKGLKPGEYSDNEITVDSMHEYYSRLIPLEDA